MSISISNKLEFIMFKWIKYKKQIAEALLRKAINKQDSLIKPKFFDKLYNNIMIKNIVIYGGAFDPPHIGHLKLIDYLAAEESFDEIWLMPCGDRNDKKLLMSKDQRFRLMNRIFQKRKDKNILISSEQIEMSLKMGKYIHTYDLLKELKFKFAKNRFHFVIGADVLHTMHTWGNVELLQKENSFIIFHRKGFQLLMDKVPPQHMILNMDLPEMSSSYIKNVLYDENKSKQLKEQELKGSLSQEVIQFLKEEKIL